MTLVEMQYLGMLFICILVANKNTAVEECTADEFECGNGGCIPAKYTCDNDPDCDDLSDERNCNSTQPPPCPEGQHRCDNGNCIEKKDSCSTEIYTSWILSNRSPEYTATSNSVLSHSYMFYVSKYSAITTSPLNASSDNNTESGSIETSSSYMTLLADIKNKSEETPPSNKISEFDHSLYQTKNSILQQSDGETLTLTSMQSIYLYATRNESYISISSNNVLLDNRTETVGFPYSSFYYNRDTSASMYTSLTITLASPGIHSAMNTSPIESLMYSLYPSFTSEETESYRELQYISSLISPSYISQEINKSIIETDVLTTSTSCNSLFLSPTKSKKESDHISKVSSLLHTDTWILIKSQRQNNLSDLDTPLSVTDQVSSGKRINTLMNSSPVEVRFSSSQPRILRLYTSEQLELYEISSNKKSNDVVTMLLESDSFSLRMQTITKSVLSVVKYIHTMAEIVRPSSAISDLFLVEENIYSSSLQTPINQTASSNLFLSREQIYESISSSEITQSIYMSEISLLATTPIDENTTQQDSLFLLVIIPFTVLFLMILIGFLVLVYRHISSFRRKGNWTKECAKDFKVDMGQPDLVFYKAGNRIVTSSYSSLTQLYFNNNLCECS